MIRCSTSAIGRPRILSLLAVAAISLTVLAAHPASAQTLGIDVSSTTGTTLLGNNQTFGWAFTTTKALTVTDLGLWDDSANGLAQATPVGLWNSSGTLLASVTLPVGTVGTTTTASAATGNAWRFLSIAPVVLGSGGTYTVGAFFGGGSPDKQLFALPSTTGSGLTFLGGETSAASGSLAFPPPATLTTSGGYLGPNLRFTAAAGASEPTSMTLAGLVLPIAAGWRIRRRRRA